MRHWISLLAVGVAIVTAASSAFADGLFNSSSDVIGFSLGMTQDEAQNFAKSQFPGNPIVAMPAQIGTPNYSVKLDVGFLVNASGSKSESENTDRIAVLFNPASGSKDIFAISRRVQFVSHVSSSDGQHFQADGTLVLRQTALEGLTRKYGPPIVTPLSMAHGMVQYMWFLSKPVPSALGCSFDPSNRSSYYHEPLWEEGSLDDLAARAGNNFAQTVNQLARGRGRFDNCGVVLRVNMELFDLGMMSNQNDPKYIKIMSEDLIDLTKGATEMRTFAKSFFEEAKMADESKVQRDSKNAPKL